MSQETSQFLKKSLRGSDAQLSRKLMLFLRFVSARYQIRQLLEIPRDGHKVKLEFLDELESLSDFIEVVGESKFKGCFIELNQRDGLRLFLVAVSWLIQKTRKSVQPCGPQVKTVHKENYFGCRLRQKLE
jgi:hypothetical protein